MTKLIVAFRSSANAPKNITLVITDNVRNSHAPKTTLFVSVLIKSGSKNIKQNYKNTNLKTEQKLDTTNKIIPIFKLQPIFSFYFKSNTMSYELLLLAYRLFKLIDDF